MATNFGIVGRAAQGPSVWSGAPLSGSQVEDARFKIKELYPDAFKNGSFDTSNTQRNIEVAGGLKAMGLDPGQMSEITGVDAATVNRFVTDNREATDAAGNDFRDTNPRLFPGIVSRPLSPSTVMSAPVERIGTPTRWDIDSDQTVQGQIKKILDPNNPLMVQARTTADEEFNRRGLVNSGMAATAAQDAMLRAAVPIATSDAATYGKAAGYNADQLNQVATKNAEMANTVGMANLNANNSWAQANLGSNTQLEQTRMQIGSQQAIAQLNSDTQRYVNQLDSATKLQAQQMQNENQTLLNTNQQAASMFNQAMVSMANIQNNPNLDAANKTQAIAQVWGTLQTQVKVLSQVTGLNLNLNFAGFPGFNDQGVFVGIGNEGPAATPAPTAAPVANAEPTAGGAG